MMTEYDQGKWSIPYSVIYCVVLNKITSGEREGRSAKNLSTVALLNKYLSALHRTNLLTVVLIKVDC